MIIDTSAIIAILRDEKDAVLYARAIADAKDRRCVQSILLNPQLSSIRAGIPSQPDVSMIS